MSEITVSKDTTGRGRRKLKLPAPKRVFGVLVKTLAALVVIGAVVVLIQAVLPDPSKDSAFSVDGKQYSKKQISAMAAYAATQSGLSKTQMAKQIYQLYRTQAASKQANIVPNNSELKTARSAANFKNATITSAKDYVTLYVYDQALNQAYTRYSQGGYKGELFIFDFSQKVIARRAGTIAGQGDAKLIAQDRAYAKTKAQAAYDDYTKKGISFADLSEKIKSNETGSYIAGSTDFDSASAQSLQSQISSPDVYTYVTAQTKPGVSKLLVGKVISSFDEKNPAKADGYYYFVKLDAAGKAIDDPSGDVAAQKHKMQGEFYGV